MPDSTSLHPATLSVVIPTPGRGRPLARALRSVAPQLQAGDECIVVGDCFDGPLPDVQETVERFAGEAEGRFVYIPFNGGQHSWGHFEINYGMHYATGGWLSFLDDDDVYAPGAFRLLRRVIAELPEPRPLLFRFQSYWGAAYWSEGCRELNGKLVAKQDYIGGHCAVFPNIPERLGRWEPHYQGDYSYIRSTLDKWPNKDDDAIWREEVIAIARPGAWAP